MTFSGSLGQRVSIQLRESTYGSSTGSATVAVRAPDGSTLTGPTGFGTGGVFLDTLTLLASGTYRIALDPQGTNTGQVSVKVHDVPADPVATLTPGGDPGTVVTTVPGQNAMVRFEGTADQRISLNLTGGTFGTAYNTARVSVLRPDGTALIGATAFSNPGVFLDTRILPTTGSYTLLVDPQGTSTGQVTVKMHDVPADPTSTLAPGDDPATVATTVPGQNGVITFAGTAGQRISAELTGGTFGTAYNTARVSVLRLDGTALISATAFSNPGVFLDTKVLPTTGTYTLLVDPQGTNTGQVAVKVHNVPTDSSNVIEVGSDFVEVGTVVPGQNVALTATLTAATAYRLRVDRSSGNAIVRVTGPAGEVVDSGERASAPDDVVTFTPTTSGTHTIMVDPEGSARGSWRLELYRNVGAPRFSAPANSADWLTSSITPVSWTTDFAGTVAGHAVSVTSSPTTDPGTTSTQTSWGYTEPVPDGENWVHVRTVLSTGEAGVTAHHRLRVDTTAPVVSGLSSLTHPDPEQAGGAEATVTWTGSDAASGVSGYSYTMSRDRAVEPDDTVDITSATWRPGR